MREWITEHAVMAYQVLLPFFWVASAVAVIILFPLALWRKTRSAAGVGLFVVSYIFGATTWFLGAAVTFGSFGETYTDEGGAIVEYHGHIVGDVIDADVTNTPCVYHWHLKKE